MANEDKAITKQPKQRAKRVEEIEPGVWLYSDGTKRNERGHLVELHPALREREITSDTAHDMIALREAKRMRLYNIGAQRAVQDTALLDEFGYDAHIVERGMTLQTIATTPDAGKAAVMAAQALDLAQGLTVKGKPDADPANTIAATRDLLRELARIAGGLALPSGEVIDADLD